MSELSGMDLGLGLEGEEGEEAASETPSYNAQTFQQGEEEEGDKEDEEGSGEEESDEDEAPSEANATDALQPNGEAQAPKDPAAQTHQADKDERTEESMPERLVLEDGGVVREGVFKDGALRARDGRVVPVSRLLFAAQSPILKAFWLQDPSGAPEVGATGEELSALVEAVESGRPPAADQAEDLLAVLRLAIHNQMSGLRLECVRAVEAAARRENVCRWAQGLDGVHEPRLTRHFQKLVRQCLYGCREKLPLADWTELKKENPRLAFELHGDYVRLEGGGRGLEFPGSAAAKRRRKAH